MRHPRAVRTALSRLSRTAAVYTTASSGHASRCAGAAPFRDRDGACVAGGCRCPGARAAAV